MAGVWATEMIEESKMMSTGLTLLLPVCLFLFIVAALTVKLRQLSVELKLQGQALQTIKAEMNALLSCERGMGKRIRQHQQEVRGVIERQDRLEVSDGATTSYKQAMALLQKGMSTDELIDACDLSRGELELLSRLKTAAESVPASKAA